MVKTGQGFSVNYKEKFLYSKYNPSKAILQKIDSMEILPGTVILAFSPVLCYGLNELVNKVPENCAVLLCERDKELREIAENEISKIQGATEQGGAALQGNFENKKFSNSDRGAVVAVLSERELYNLPVILQKPSYTFECGFSLLPVGSYRRVIRIDFSAGSQFYTDFYNELENACVSSIKQFWTNRITLLKFGRRFSRNVFRNLKLLSETTPLQNYIGKISKPIVVFGAGETSEIGAEKIKLSREKYFVLCADTAFPMLTGYGIIPDGIVIDEAQSVISESFIGAKKAKFIDEDGQNHRVQIFQNLCSLPHVAGRKFPKEQITFYATEYAPNNFFEDLKSRDFFPPVVPAFGSVGITAYFLANIFNANSDVPVTFYGLDFSYSAGKTHAKGTPAHNRQLREANRIKSLGNYGASFGPNAIKLSSSIFSSPILRTYAETFEQVKANIGNLISEWKAENQSSIKNQSQNQNNFEQKSQQQSHQQSLQKSVSKYLENERKSLEELREILSGKKELPKIELDEKITEICKSREYLYLHFPDGYKFSMSLDFLKRIRGEIDFFLKDIK